MSKKYPISLNRPAISEQNLARALAAATGRVHAWIVLAAFAGLRSIEVPRLHRRDVFLDDAPPYLVAHAHKGLRVRAVPISTPVAKVLAECPAHGWLFMRSDRHPFPLQHSAVNKAVNEHLRSLGLSDTYDTCRERFKQQVFAETGDVRLVEELLGFTGDQSINYAARVVDAVCVPRIQLV